MIVFYQYRDDKPQPKKYTIMWRKKQRLGDGDAVRDKNK